MRTTNDGATRNGAEMQTDEEVGQDGPAAVAWTPLQAAVWIKTGGDEPAFSDALCDLRWVRKDTGPGSREEKEFGLAFDCYANEQNGWASRPDARNDSGDSKAIPEILRLKAELIMGAIGASGLPKGAAPRVAIPSIEWTDLDFMGEEADTAWSRNGFVYTRVRLLRDNILRWPKRTTISSVVCDAATKPDAIAQWLRKTYPARPPETVKALMQIAERDGPIKKFSPRTFDTALKRAWP